MNRLLLIDGSWYLHRIFSVIAFQGRVNSVDQLPKNFLSMVCKDILETRSTHAAVLWDAPSSFRYDIYPEYKANRKKEKITDIFSSLGLEAPPGLEGIDVYSYLKTIKKVLKYAGISSVTVAKMEADDLLGAGAVHLGKDNQVLLGTHDKDLMQVVGGNVKLYWPASGKQKEPIYVDAKKVFEVKKVKPEQIFDYLCLCGDKIDNIPGVDRWGNGNAAAKMLAEYGSVEKCMKSGTDVGKLLKKNRKVIAFAAKLVALDTECWKPKLADLEIQPPNLLKLTDLIKELPKPFENLMFRTNLSKSKGLFK